MNSIINFILFLCLIQSFVISSEWIDTSDMTDSRLLRNRHRHSSYTDNSIDQNDYKIDYKKARIVYKTNDQNEAGNQLEIINQQCNSNDHYTEQQNKVIDYLEITYQSEKQIKNERNNTEMLNNCLLKNKELTEDLICFRNLKSLYTRYTIKINQIVQSMNEKSQKIEIHPYSNEFFFLMNVLKHENCLSAVDDLEKIISKLDRFLYQIEPIDYTKELLFASFGLLILFSFFYIYKYLRIKYLFYSLLLFFVYAHEYYYLILAKKSEIAYEMKKLNRCQEQGLFTGLLGYILSKFYSPFSFKGDECDINEDYLYIDAVFKINPIMPIFTILPKLFTKTLIIFFENSAIAFKKFSSQLPIFHVYPILIIFLGLIFYLSKLILDWRVEIRKVDQQGKFRLAKLRGEINKNLMIKNKLRRTVSIDSFFNSKLSQSTDLTPI